MGVKFQVMRFGARVMIEAPHPGIESCKCGKVGFLIGSKPPSKEVQELRKEKIEACVCNSKQSIEQLTSDARLERYKRALDYAMARQTKGDIKHIQQILAGDAT